MNKNKIIYYEQPVNDDGNVLIADFTAQRNNGVVQNIGVSFNTIPGYQTNKDKVINAFDDFLAAIQSETVQVSDETPPIESESESETVINSESESEVASESESDSVSESQSESDSVSDSQSDSDSQSESESETDSASDSNSDSTSALSQ